MSIASRLLGLVAAFSVGAIAHASSPRSSSPRASEGGGATPARLGAVRMELYVMSQCPFATQVENTLAEVAGALGGALDLTIDYIGTVGPEGELSSMHGPEEVVGDKAQLCAARQAPDKLLTFIGCQNRAYTEVAHNWESCAVVAGIPVGPLRSCIGGSEGETLARTSFLRSKERGAAGSPTMFIDGRPYTGRRGKDDFLRALCAAFSGDAPAACKRLAKLPVTNVTVLGDKRCAECRDPSSSVSFRLANPQLRHVDYSDPEGRKLYREIGDLKLPAVLLDGSLDADKDGASSLRSRLKPTRKPGLRFLDVGSTWNPVCLDPGGCSKESCRFDAACAKEVPNRLDVFVMSHCPFASRALTETGQVLADFDRSIDFRIHFIATGTAKDGFQSLFGPAAVEEDLRQVCAMKHYPKSLKWLDYVVCRAKDVRSEDWASCAVDGIDAKVLRDCAEGTEGARLLEANIKLANSMGIGASPTWLVNNKFRFAGIDAKTIRENFCAHNASLAGCRVQPAEPEEGHEELHEFRDGAPPPGHPTDSDEAGGP